jgi:hypothetical protein
MPRRLAERGWLYRPRKLAEARKLLEAVISDDEIELGELMGKLPDEDVLVGVARRRHRIQILRAALAELPNMALRKRDENV